MPTLQLPPHNPNCAASIGGEAPRITSPTNGSEYFLEEGGELQLSCQATADVHLVYWYVDNSLYARAKPHEEVFFAPQKGRVQIACADDKGRSSSCSILVR